MRGLRPAILVIFLYVLTANVNCQAQVGLFIRPNTSTLSSPISGQTWFFNSTNYTTSVWNGSAFQLTSAPLNNFVATNAPTTTNDNTQGYSQGSEWYNTSNSYVYTCVSAVTNAAVWVQINNLGSLSIPLTQLQAGGASSGQSLVYNGTHWAPAAPNILLSQVLQSGASTGQIPIWNGSAWVPGTTSGGGAVALSQLTQSGAIAGEGIHWNGSAWVAVNPLVFFQGPQNDNEICTQDGGNPTMSYGWVTTNMREYSADNTIQSSDPTFIYVDTGGNEVTLTLPSANDVIGKVYTIIPLAGTFSNSITVQTNGVDAIQLYGSNSTVSSIVLDPAANNGYAIVLQADGTGPPGTYIQMTPIASCLVSAQSNSFNAVGNNSYYVDTSGGSYTATLPDATECAGQIIKFKIVNGGNALTFATTNSQNLDGSSSPSQSLSNSNDYMVVESDGSNWWIFSYNNS
jgi:hypothetical protein